MFKFKGIKDLPARTLGFSVRFLGIDFSVLLLGWMNEWRLIDIRIPVNYGIYFQTLGLVLSVGRLPYDSIYPNNSN